MSNEQEKIFDECKIIGNEEHRLVLYKLGKAEPIAFDGRPRRFKLVYTWYNKFTGGVKGQEVQGATWNDYRQCRKHGMFGHYNLF